MRRPVTGRVLLRFSVWRWRIVLWWDNKRRWPPKGRPPPKPVNYTKQSFWRDYFKLWKNTHHNERQRLVVIRRHLFG